jgi:hypothetical protein
MAMPSGSSKPWSLKSKLARSSSEGAPMAPPIACIVTVSSRTRLSWVIWWRQAQQQLVGELADEGAQGPGVGLAGLGGEGDADASAAGRSRNT